jgi:hypothetical protein
MVGEIKLRNVNSNVGIVITATLLRITKKESNGLY